MDLRRRILIGTASAAALVCAGAGPALAAEEPNAVSEVIVTGIRASLQQSIETKRNADALVDAITAEDVGKFPDKNVAESLQRVPGVTIQREFGEGERISIRGTAPVLNRTLLNGHGVSTADWFILDQFKASRSFNYLMLPSEIVGKVEVYKSPVADIDEGGVGGVVDVHTRKPLDLAAFSVAASLGASYDEKSRKTTPVGSGMISWHNADSTFGALVGLIYDKREIRRDGIEVLGYQDVTNGAGHVAGLPAGQTAVVPTLIGSSLFNQTRERKGANFAIQWSPNSNFEVNLTGLYSHMDADNFNQNYMAWITNKIQGLGDPGALFTINKLDNGTATQGTFATPGGQGVVFDAIDRIAQTEVRSLDLDSSWRPNDQWRFHGQVGYTDAKGSTDLQPFWETSAVSGLTYDVSGGLPKVHFTDINPATSTDQLSLGWASANTTVNDDSEFYTYVDGERFLDDAGVFKSIKFGLKYTDHDREVVQTYGQRRALLPWTGPGATACSGHPCSLADVQGGLTPGDYLDGISGPGVLSQYMTADQKKIEAIYAALPKADIYNPAAATQVGGCVGLLNCQHFGPLESFSLNEKTYGGFVMAKIGGDGWRGNLGVRVVRTKETSSAWQVGVPVGTPGAIQNPFGLIAPIDAAKEYTDVLPSANIAFDLKPDLILRVAAGRTVSRPDYAQMASFTSLTDSLLTGSGGNPNLNPYRANQFDVSLEWYFASQSLLSVSVFYKDVSTYIVQGSFVERHPLQLNNASDPRITNPANNCVAAGVDLYTCNYTIGRPVNVEGGPNTGVEVIYQQPIWHGFGVQANATYSDASSTAHVPVPSNSKYSYNLTGYYENERLSARLSYNFRSKFFIDYDAERGFRPLYSNDIASLDGSLNINVTPHVAVSLDALNMLDEKLTEYYDNDPNRIGRIYKNGRMVFANLRIKF
jgi:iron complex outermembrane receptor protein